MDWAVESVGSFGDGGSLVIVEEPPYDLVAVFADADAKLLLEEVIERAQRARMVAPFRWRSLRDARRDAFRADPVSAVGPLLKRGQSNYLFTWDHQGSGRENDEPVACEKEVERALVVAGVGEQRVMAIAFVPEVESLLVPVWPRVVQIVSGIRGGEPPSADFILATAARKARKYRVTLPPSFEDALAEYPKEVFHGLLSAVNLRRSASIYQRLGQDLSIAGMREGPQMERLLSRLEGWFPGQGWGT